MKKMPNLTYLFIVVVSTFIIGGCSKEDSPAAASASSSFGADMTNADFLAAIQINGGDPRGTYTPNKPFVQVFHTNSAYSITEVAGGTNSGSGTIKLEGSSATSGTYSTSNLALTVNFSVTVSHAGQSNTVPIAITLGSLSGNHTGTWQTIGSDKIVFKDGSSSEPADTMRYAVTSKGFFFGMEEVGTEGSTIVAAGFKK